MPHPWTTHCLKPINSLLIHRREIYLLYLQGNLYLQGQEVGETEPEIGSTNWNLRERGGSSRVEDQLITEEDTSSCPELQKEGSRMWGRSVGLQEKNGCSFISGTTTPLPSTFHPLCLFHPNSWLHLPTSGSSTRASGIEEGEGSKGKEVSRKSSSLLWTPSRAPRPHTQAGRQPCSRLGVSFPEKLNGPRGKSYRYWHVSILWCISQLKLRNKVPHNSWLQQW